MENLGNANFATDVDDFVKDLLEPNVVQKKVLRCSCWYEISVPRTYCSLSVRTDIDGQNRVMFVQFNSSRRVTVVDRGIG